jgi:hypothetical protein
MERLKAVGRDFNLPAAKYCVDLAKALHLLTENGFWTWSAHVLQLLPAGREEEGSFHSELSIEERLFWFRVFLEDDGAALLFLASKILRVGRLLQEGTDWNDVANEMMDYIYTSYLTVLEDIRERAETRQLLEKRKHRPYRGKSGAHQCFVHLNTMARIGLLISNGREYHKGPNGILDRFVNAVPDIRALEAVISKRNWPSIASSVFSGDLSREEGWSSREILEQASEFYARVMKTGVSLCSLSTVIETIQLGQLAQTLKPISYEECILIFRQEQARNPKKIRFHVDRIGRPAFIAIS